MKYIPDIQRGNRKLLLPRQVLLLKASISKSDGTNGVSTGYLN
jgi:hypothetical protein